MNYSVVILTKNEELAIRQCLSSVNSDDIWIIDSESTDKTVEMAKSIKNVTVIKRPFDNYANQRNFALNLDFKYEWILMLDADERLSISSRTFLNDLPNNSLSDDISIVSFLRHDYFLGRWLRGASGYPLHFPRLFRKGTVKVNRSVNEEYFADGKNLKVKHHIDHYPFTKGIDYWYERHLTYSSMEVDALNSMSQSDSLRSKVKQFFYKLPFRYLIIFIYLYIFQRGFLAGHPGYLYCLMRASYEVMIIVKQKQKRQRKVDS